MERDFATLYKTRSGQASWYHTLSEEAADWLNELAVFIDEEQGGREPTWQAVYERFCERFPDEAPRVAGTISSTVRRLRG